MVQDIKFSEIKIGDTSSMSKTVTEFDVYTFAGITGDFNPVHINAEFAKKLYSKSVLHMECCQLDSFLQSSGHPCLVPTLLYGTRADI